MQRRTTRPYNHMVLTNKHHATQHVGSFNAGLVSVVEKARQICRFAPLRTAAMPWCLTAPFPPPAWSTQRCGWLMRSQSRRAGAALSPLQAARREGVAMLE